MDRRDATRPPADPHPNPNRGLGLALPDRAFRIEVTAALVVGVLLIGGGMLMWRRPHSAVDTAVSEAGASEGSLSVALRDAGAPDAEASAVGLSEIHMLGCHDKGSKRTPPDECDRLPAVEAALSSAIAQSAACVPASVPGGTIEYVANVSFLHHKVSVRVPKSGRSFHDARTVDACAASVRSSLQAVALDSVVHEHARYKLSVVATYRGGRSDGASLDGRSSNSGVRGAR